MDALVIIDMQKWMFRYPARMAQVNSLVSNISQLMAAFEGSGFPIYDIRAEHKSDRSTWSRLMLKYDYPCLLEDTPDAESVDGYVPSPTAKTVVKTANSAFLRTNFENILGDDRITRLVLSGVFIKGCVGLTAADAAQLGFEVVLIEDAIGHGDSSSRAPFFRWLVKDYELELLKTIEYLAIMERLKRGRSPPDY